MVLHSKIGGFSAYPLAKAGKHWMKSGGASAYFLTFLRHVTVSNASFHLVAPYRREIRGCLIVWPILNKKCKAL